MITSFFTLFAIGVGAGIGLSIMFDQNSTDINIPEIHDVLGAQTGCDVKDTEQGSIEVIACNIPDVLPLCITQDKLNDWYCKLAVKGGYDAICGYIDLYQKNEYKGRILVDYELYCHEPCYTDYWCATFSLPDGVVSIELDSNQWPSGAVPLVDGNPTIPGKEVTLVGKSLWKGCDENNQKFTLIQTHKSDFFRVPSSD